MSQVSPHKQYLHLEKCNIPGATRSQIPLHRTFLPSKAKPPWTPLWPPTSNSNTRTNGLVVKLAVAIGQPPVRFRVSANHVIVLFVCRTSELLFFFPSFPPFLPWQRSLFLKRGRVLEKVYAGQENLVLRLVGLITVLLIEN